MAGHQRLFENVKGKPIDMDKVCAEKENKWIKAYVRTESGCFAFSDIETAKNFAGDMATVTIV